MPIEIKLTGVLHPDKDRRLMIGQNLGAYVSIGTLPMGDDPTYSWDVEGGYPFQSYNVIITNGKPESATVTGFTTQTTPTLSTYLRTETPNDFLVSCAFYWPWLNVTLSLEENGKSVVPQPFVTGVYIEKPAMIPDAYDPEAVQLTGSTTPGIMWVGTIDTPYPFDNQGDGWWTIVQLVTVNRSRDGLVPYDTRPDPDILVNGLYGLDYSFPYPTPEGVPYDFSHAYENWADGEQDFDEDSPAASTFNIATQALDSFDTFFLYYPPGVAQYVPLKSLDWYWYAHVHSTSPPYNWEWDAQEAAWGYSGTFPAHPTWNYRHDVNDWEYRSP